MDYKEIIKERLKILPDQLRSFVLDENWRSDVEKISRQFSLNEEKSASLENEIFLVLLCFEPKNDFIENIKRELEMDTNMAGWISEEAGKNIFSKVSNEIDSVWQSGGTENATSEKKSSGVGGSFEQIILNQAKAMQPARPTDESGRIMNQESRIMGEKKEPPNNLPTEKQDKNGLGVPDYSKGEDPYREPIN